MQPIQAALLLALPAQDFTVVPLDGAAPPALPIVLDANELGHAVGSGSPAGGPADQPLRFELGGIQLLPLVAGDSIGSASAVNDLGQATGRSTLVQPTGPLTTLLDRAVRLEPGGAVTDLEAATTGGANLQLFRGAAIDSMGRVAGFGRDPSIPAGRAFLWNDGEIIDLGNLPGTDPQRPSTANGLNDAGVVVGRADDDEGFQRAFRWANGAMIDLHAAAGVPDRTSDAHDLTESGVIAGSADFSADLVDLREPAIFFPNGVVEQIGTLGGSSGEAFSINAGLDVVGVTANGEGSPSAFLYRDRALIDLNELIDPTSGWTLLEARKITDSGLVVGNGRLNGQQRPFLLSPIPCPGSYLSFGPGCPGTGGFVPALAGFGCPTAGGELRFELQKGLGGAPGLLLFGTGFTQLDLSPCSVLLDPLLPVFLPLQLAGDGPGAGSLTLELDLAPGTPPGVVWIQALVIDAEGANFYASAPPLRIVIG